MLPVSVSARRRRDLRRRLTPPATTPAATSPSNIHHSMSRLVRLLSPPQRRPAAWPLRPPRSPPPRGDIGQYRRAPANHQKAPTNRSHHGLPAARGSIVVR